MENKKSVEQQIKDKVKPIFEKELKNSTKRWDKPFRILWRPNNYRRSLEVIKKTDKIIEKIKKIMPDAEVGKNNKLVFVTDHKRGIVLQYGKKILTGIYAQPIIRGEKEVYCITARSVSDIESRLLEKREQIRLRIDEALKEFCTQVGIRMPHTAQPKWKRYEDWLKGDEYIDKLPKDLIIHDTYFKKVYDEGIEFKGPAEHGYDPAVLVTNYIKNRAIEDVSPEIVMALNEVFSVMDPLRVIKAKCKTIEDVISYGEIVRLLSIKERKEFSDWSFNSLQRCDT